MVTNGYPNSVRNGMQLMTLAVPTGNAVDPPADEAVDSEYVVLNRGWLQLSRFPWVSDRENEVPVATWRMYMALLSESLPWVVWSAASGSVLLVARYCAASRVADSRFVHAW